MNKSSAGLLWARWQHLRAGWRMRWQGLATRERRAVTLAALVLGSGLAWLTLIEPPLKTIAYWQAETPKLRSQTEALEVLLRDIGGPARGEPLDVALRHSLEASGLGEHYQLQPPGVEATETWQLTFTDAPADGVIDWLLGNPRQFSLEVTEARLHRTAPANSAQTPGTLSGTVRMNQASSAKEAS
ncbi:MULTISPECIES: type II secretion system protein GspM [unclassified Pseudomonas]|uniref:type II secretion system protein GspM n=1 Tax=unclassified Pseudomonas TaxID=196821 RepID=UPI000595906F|nr:MULTISPECIES: type II secretion system protein GspM [unclassified Pseudomonas]MBD0682989.1 type II secretion system protein M [Pseudomonas sp. PSB18]